MAQRRPVRSETACSRHRTPLRFLSTELDPERLVFIDETGASTKMARLLYLPPYSPDFNPIENAFAKLKALLRRAFGCELWRKSADGLATGASRSGWRGRDTG